MLQVFWFAQTTRQKELHGPAETEPRLALEGIDVIIDFSAPPSIDSTLKAAVDLGVAYVLASTGLSEKDEETLSEAAKHSSNCRFQL